MTDETITVTLSQDSALAGFLGSIGSVQIDAESLCDAFKAVLPHAGGKDAPQWQRVRVETASIGTDIAILATDARTLVCATIPAALQGDDSMAEALAFDIAPDDAKLIADVFKPGKDDGDVMLELRITDTQLHVTDVSGLFDGHRLTVPLLSGYERATKQLHLLYRLANNVTHELEDATVINAALLARFSKSAAVYGKPIVLHGCAGSDNKAIAITCGGLFFGALMPMSDNATVDASKTLIAGWAARDYLDLEDTNDNEEDAA